MKIKFVPQDCWIGIYWKQDKIWFARRIMTTWYLCLIPCFPIIWETSKAMRKIDVKTTLNRMAANAKANK